MMTFNFCLILALFAIGGHALRWKQCGGEEYVLIKNLDISPTVVKFPGESKFSIEASIQEVLNNSDSTITMKRKTFLGLMRIPCLFKLGSCTYKDTCNLPKQIISENYGGVMGPIVSQVMKSFDDAGAQLNCSLPVQEIKLDQVPIKLPKIPMYMVFLGKGDYYIRVVSKDKTSGKTILCIDMDFTLG